MGDQQQQRSTSTPDNFYNVLGITKGATSIKDLCRAFMKWGPNDKSPSNNKSTSVDELSSPISDRDKSYHGSQEDFIISNPTTPTRYNNHRNSIVEDQISSRSSSSVRRSKTPSPSPRSLSRETSRRSTTPTSQMHNASRRSNSVSEFPTRTFQTSSRKTSSLSAYEDPSQCLSPQSTSSSSSSNNMGRCKGLSRSTSTGTSTSTSSVDGSPLSRNKSRNTKGATPIVFSQSTAPKKPPPVERKLECTLEDLCYGVVKKIMITREVISNGMIIQEEEKLKMDVKPGWMKGTKVTFDGKGNLKPGFLPADIIFCIDEKKHPLFRREGDDLELGVEVPLVQALTNCSINVPLLGGDKMRLSFENVIIFPGYEKVIKGQGMPNSKNGGKKRES